MNDLGRIGGGVDVVMIEIDLGRLDWQAGSLPFFPLLTHILLARRDTPLSTISCRKQKEFRFIHHSESFYNTMLLH